MLVNCDKQCRDFRTWTVCIFLKSNVSLWTWLNIKKQDDIKTKELWTKL